MNFRVLLPEPVAAAGVDELRRSGLEIVEPPDRDFDSLVYSIRDCQGLLIRTTPAPMELLREARDLRVISRHGVGLDNIDLGYCADHGIIVTSTPEANAISVAEHTIAMILALSKNLMPGDRAVRDGNFTERDRFIGEELADKTLGIVGMGRIGRLVSRKAAYGLGMRVLAFDPYISDSDLAEEAEVAEMSSVLGNSDFLSLHMPLTPATRDLINAEQIALMKDGAYVINCARGGIVDEAVLASALESGKLSGVALDVFTQEPLSPKDPLLGLKNVLVTPHIAAHTHDSLTRMALHAARGIVSVCRGERPQWEVDIQEKSLRS